MFYENRSVKLADAARQGRRKAGKAYLHPIREKKNCLLRREARSHLF